MFNIIVGFSKPINRIPIIGYLFSWAIRVVENAEYSHTYIKFYSEKFDRWMIYEASGTSCHFIELSRWKQHAKEIYEYPILCSEEVRSKVITRAIDLASASYGLKQIFGIFIVKIARLFNKDINNPFSDRQSTWVCSEITKALLEEMGINIPIKQDNITPKDIQVFLENKLKEKENG